MADATTTTDNTTTDTAAAAAPAKESLAEKIGHAFSLAATWITSEAGKIKALVTKAGDIEPEVAAGISEIVAKTETFLASATPAIDGEGLNFPADSVAYNAFVDLVKTWQTVGSTILKDVKAL